MKERPILFSAPMVRAILEGRKTQTRRVMKPQPYTVWGCGVPLSHVDRQRRYGIHAAFNVSEMRVDRWLPCPYGAPGDRLWVRETFACADPSQQICAYRADGRAGAWFAGDGERFFLHHGWVVNAADNSREGKWYGLGKYGGKWRPGIHMPRWASRITLEVTGVRVERLHAITEEDAKAEGCLGYPGVVDATPREEFEELWKDINGLDSWRANPWVWVVEFRRAELEQAK